jgi:hypothetical protein
MHSIEHGIKAFKDLLGNPPRFGVGLWHITKALSYADLRMKRKAQQTRIYERLTGNTVITLNEMEPHALAVKICEFLEKELDKCKSNGYIRHLINQGVEPIRRG